MGLLLDVAPMAGWPAFIITHTIETAMLVYMILLTRETRKKG